MEEFKNLKEIIELCKDELENNDENVNTTLDLIDLKELQNLINKNKELEKERDGIYADYQELGKEKLELEEKCEEQEKIIELMNEYILKEYISPEICSKHTPEDCYADIYDDEACKKCILDYFRKKAKGE